MASLEQSTSAAVAAQATLSAPDEAAPLTPAAQVREVTTAAAADDATLESDAESDTATPTISPPHRQVARKDIGRQLAIEHQMRLWPSLPAVSTADLHSILEALPGAAPYDIACVVVRRYSLDGDEREELYRRLTAMVYAKKAAQREVVGLLPLGETDGNTAIVTVQRVASWASRDDRPERRPFE